MITDSSTTASVPTRAPFRWTERDRHALPVEVRGALPTWLDGQLVRVAPALFATQGWRAEHWFDALALLYGFSFRNGQVAFQQRLLASRAAEQAARGESLLGTFATPLRRSFWKRMFQPIPPLTDNTNVNVVPWQGAWLALTETPLQQVIGSDDLEARGLYTYSDKLRSGMSMTVHPRLDPATNALVNVGYAFGPSTTVTVFHQQAESRARVVEATLQLKRAPYIHDFGLTAKHVVLVDQPLRVRGASMLFSERALADHYRWEPEQGTRLWKLERATGKWTSYETEALFCFHVVNTFEDGEDTVFDFLAYDDASLVDGLRTDRLARGDLPAMAPRLVRTRLSPGNRRAELEPLSSTGFEFPTIAHRAERGLPYEVCWGTALHPEHQTWRSEVVRVELSSDRVRSFSEPGVTYGEPVFVPRPHARHATEGVLLTLGSHHERDLATLAVLDAGSMEPLAHCDVGLSLPLGFHGNYRAR